MKLWRDKWKTTSLKPCSPHSLAQSEFPCKHSRTTKTTFPFVKKCRFGGQKENMNTALEQHSWTQSPIIALEKQGRWCHGSCWLSDRQFPQRNMRPFGLPVREIGSWMAPMSAGLYSLWECCPHWWTESKGKDCLWTWKESPFFILKLLPPLSAALFSSPFFKGVLFYSSYWA